MHKARLISGEEVAVKIQFPYLRTQYKYDLVIIKFFVWVCQRVLEFNDSRDTDLLNLYEVFKNALVKELDFLHEIDNAQRTAEFFRNNSNVCIPKYYKEFSSSRLITMEFMNAVKVLGRLSD